MVYYQSFPLTEWFIAYLRMVSLFLLPCSPSLNLTEECFPAAIHAGFIDIFAEDESGMQIYSLQGQV